MPISEYPNVSPPSIQINASFSGANPKLIAQTIATPLEERLKGLENMLYMFSQATADGRLTLTVTFRLGTDPNLALQLVRNRVSQALPHLPEITRQAGVTVVKSSPDLTMIVHLISPDRSYDALFLRNYALMNVKDELAKINGVGFVRLRGSGDYAMRIWLNPDKIAERGLSANDVINAIREQNLDVATGIIGGAPNANFVNVQLPINAKGRLTLVEEFKNIIIHAGVNGNIVYLQDVARIELGAEEYNVNSLLNNETAVTIPLYKSSDANTIEVSNSVHTIMEKLKEDFPPGVEYKVVYDPASFVKDSIIEVIKTLLEALLLVIIVVIVFLQTWRASLIPFIAVPVSIIGTFSLMWLFGFSINIISLFGLVLAIGIVVDDAIVVVENVKRNIQQGLEPIAASYKAMQEVSAPIIAITLSLVAVFVPIAFISGLTGQFYKQFALTIAISTVISAINSLTLSPALAAVLLKNDNKSINQFSKLSNSIFERFFVWFNKLFHNSSIDYANNISKLLERKIIVIVIYVILLFITTYEFNSIPKGFIPSQDRQYLIAFAQLPDGATLERSNAVIREMGEIGLDEPGVESSFQLAGLSVNGFTNSSSAGIVFMMLDSFSERSTLGLSAITIAGSLQRKFKGIEEAKITVLPPPPIRGLGTTGGFKLYIQDRLGLGYEKLASVVQEIKEKARNKKQLAGIYSNYKINVPHLSANINRIKAKQLGINIKELFDTMQVYLGSLYINDFNHFGRTFKVIAQADMEFRNTASDVLGLKVRNDQYQMVPLGSVLTLEDSFGPESATHYNGYLSADINGRPALGYTSGQAKDAIEEILNESLPKEISYEWTGLAYQEDISGNTAIYIFPLCLLLVFLVLAAQYESLILPIVVISIVPLSVMCALFGVWISGNDNSIFTQVSLFLMAGLSSKNAILIVEFAKKLEERGLDTYKAIVTSCRQRLRPVVMTSLAFIIGMLPMIFSTGAGAEMRNVIGITVVTGMAGVTFFGLFFTPVVYVLLRKLEK
jgi:multidrug efflux pump